MSFVELLGSPETTRTRPLSAPDAKPSASSSSCYVKTVVLRDWWLVRSQTEFEGKNLAVSGSPDEEIAVRVFISAPIVKRHSAVTLETADGAYVILKGFINRMLTEKGGFTSEVFKYFLFGFPHNWEEYAVRKCGDNECLCPVTSPRKTVNGCAATVGATMTPETVHAGEAIDIEMAAPAAKKSRSVSNSTKSNAGGMSCVETLRTRLKASEHVPAGEAIDVVKVTPASKCKSASDATKSNDGTSSDAIYAKTKLKTSDNVPAGDSIDDVRAAPARKLKSGASSVKSKKGATTGVKDMKSKLKTSENVPSGEAIDFFKATPAKRSKRVGSSAKSNVGATSGVHDIETKLISDAEASPTVQKGLKSPRVSPSEISTLKKSRSGRLLLHPLEFWRNEKAVYDRSRKITGIVCGTLDSGKASGTKENSKRKHKL